MISGLMYRDGVGVERNDDEAVKWLRKAADQGRAVAQAGLGTSSALNPFTLPRPLSLLLLLTLPFPFILTPTFYLTLTLQANSSSFCCPFSISLVLCLILSLLSQLQCISMVGEYLAITTKPCVGTSSQQIRVTSPPCPRLAPFTEMARSGRRTWP